MDKTESRAYDVGYPSPIPLRELSAIAVATELWRLDLKQYLENGNFKEEFYKCRDRNPRITLRDAIPIVPSAIDKITKEYIETLVFTTNDWLHYNHVHLFGCPSYSHNLILKNFDDIVCDYDGRIDYVRTAKRMMLCDRISVDDKFKIACGYCFEDDIRRIWPLVRSKFDSDKINYAVCPYLHYWVCCLENKVQEIERLKQRPWTRPEVEGVSIVELILKQTPPENRSSFQYFWNLVGLECRYQKTVSLKDYRYGLLFCGRFVLPMLSEEQLIKFVAEWGVYLIANLWRDFETEVVPRIWMYIKNLMNETKFASLIGQMLRAEVGFYVEDDLIVGKSNFDVLSVCCEIWDSVSDNFKQYAIKTILPKESFFKKSAVLLRDPREIYFLLKVLSDATLEDRRVCWSNNWLHLLASTRSANLQQIMRLCFRNEDEISSFKKNTMTKYENLAKMVKKFVENGYFTELDNALKFIYPDDITSRRELKRQCLQSTFLSQTSFLSSKMISEHESWQEFIDDAYADDVNLATDFRDKLLSEYGERHELSKFIQRRHFAPVRRFVDSFASRGHDVQQLKKHLVHGLREYLIQGVELNYPDDLNEFLLWGLGSDDRLIEFKQSISPEEVLHNFVPKEKSRSMYEHDDEELLFYPYGLDEFLVWYFNHNEKAIDEFKTRFDNVFKMFYPP